jgi:hypothetical protein
MSKIPGKIRVVGEVSNFSERNHWFFVLKDASATIRCVCFASNARKVAFKMADGAQVICTGRVDYFDQSGRRRFTPSTGELGHQNEVAGGPHDIANDPASAGGEIGRYGLSWLKVFLEGDERYRQFLLETPSRESDFRDNL